MMLPNHPVTWFTIAYRTLCVTILSTHRQVEPEGVRIDDIDVTGLRAAKCVDTSIEGLVRANLNGNPGILAVNRHCVCVKSEFNGGQH